MITVFKRFALLFSVEVVDRIHTDSTQFCINTELLDYHSDCDVGSSMVDSDLLYFVGNDCWLLNLFSEHVNQSHSGSSIHFKGVLGDNH